MEKIPTEIIENLASQENVKSIAVWNFLGTAHHCGTVENALANLEMDARLYQWNEETVLAIKEGLLTTIAK